MIGIVHIPIIPIDESVMESINIYKSHARETVMKIAQAAISPFHSSY
jgi:hypothetical protein